MIYAILITLLTLSIDLFTDYKLYLKYRNTIRPKGYVNHVRGALLRCIGLAIACYFGKWFSPVLLSFYWVAFDGGMNLLMSQNWFRRGTTAMLDKLPAWVPYACLVASIVFYIVK